MTEKLQILKMLEEGKISAKEASDLLEAVEEPIQKSQPASYSKAYSKKHLRIRVMDTRPGEETTKVNINLPIALVRFGLKMAKKFNPDLSEAGLTEEDFDSILEAVNNEVEGELMDIEADQGNTRVKIYIE